MCLLTNMETVHLAGFHQVDHCTDSRQCFMLCASGYIAGTKYAVLAAIDPASSEQIALHFIGLCKTHKAFASSQ